MAGLPSSWGDPNVLIGIDGSDDAGAVKIAPDRAVLLTVDIITPVVDDPHTFGCIAATNAVSDIFAMGGRPLAALNVACFDPALPAEIYREILAGAATVALDAGCPIVGGHTVKDKEIKFGLAVIGEVHPDHILTNAGATEGDQLLLSGPIGTAALATALKKGALDESSDEYRHLVRAMTQLNREAAHVAVAHQANALTDVTGFGLSGHGLEMADGADVTFEIEFAQLPILPGALQQLNDGFRCGGAVTNAARAEGSIDWVADLTPAEQELLHDPQTSGPLLMSVPEEHAAGALADLRAAGLVDAAPIGRVLARGASALRVV